MQGYWDFSGIDGGQRDGVFPDNFIDLGQSYKVTIGQMARLLSQILTESADDFAEHDAVVYESENISYLRLEELSNQLANTLESNGVRRGDRVGIYMNKSIRSVISIFAVLKANAICVPLDSTGSTERNQYIINDCKIRYLISQANKRRGITEILSKKTSLTHIILACNEIIMDDFKDIKVICWTEVSNETKPPPLLQTIDVDLAYILYTSGSTGKPKGVLISHLNALSFIDWASSFFEINHSDRVASHAPLHFDLSIFDIFVTMKSGGTVCLVPSEINALPTDLAKFIANQRISVWQSVPSVLVLLTNRGKLTQWSFDNLRLVLFAGEIFPTKFLRELMLKIPHAQYYNIYGATEVNDVTYYHVKEVLSDSSVPIGKACSHTEVFALDEEGRLVTQAGVTGELYVRGSNVSQGYWGDPEISEERFIQNPIQSRFHDPVYRTGDLVELDLDGNYRYIGRRDSQVKIRGYRVSLDEVEEVVLRYPSIDEVSVLTLQDKKQTQFLKAFIVAKKGSVIDYGDLKKHCLSFLPKYMLPEEIELCASLPKTSTGKVDRQKLKAIKKQPHANPLSVEDEI